ncbi:MAG: hypothetical protein ABUL72_07050 [Armatimonadota bacterium]
MTPPRSLRLDWGTPGSPHAKWSLPPLRERLDPTATIDHGALRALAFGMAFAGFCIRAFAHLSIDPMSLMIIESKGWIVFLLGQGLLLTLIRRRRDRVPQDLTIRRLLTEAKASRACPAQIVIRQWGVVTGADQGLAWIEGDRLIFKGSCTTFHPRRADIPAWVMMSRRERSLALSGRTRRTVPLPWPDGSSLQIEPIDRYDDHAVRRRAAAFDHDLDQWLTSSPETSRERSLLPPLEIHPSVLTSAKFVWGTVAATVGVALLDLVAILTPLSLNRNLPIFWIELILRPVAVVFGTLALKECAFTVRTQTIRSYCLHHPTPDGTQNRSE